MRPARGKHPGAPRPVGGDRDLASIGALVADRARCQMLVALGDGRSQPASRLAAVAEVSASTASSHLHKLVAGGLLVVENAGRRRNYRLANPEVAVLIEALERLAPARPVRSLGQSQQARAWRRARVCYDHVAGALGVELMRSLLEHGYVGSVGEPAGADPGQARYAITPGGKAFLDTLGVVVPPGRQQVRHHGDSTEDGSHISGILGSALLARFVDLGWLQRASNRRLHVTPEGRQGFGQQFGVTLDDLRASRQTVVPSRPGAGCHQPPVTPVTGRGQCVQRKRRGKITPDITPMRRTRWDLAGWVLTGCASASMAPHWRRRAA